METQLATTGPNAVSYSQSELFRAMQRGRMDTRLVLRASIYFS
jgi:hypothetical protein